jgi:mitochondrial fission protein ELM1
VKDQNQTVHEYLYDRLGRQVADTIGLKPVSNNPFMNSVAQVVEAVEVVEAASRPFPRILWNGEGANPYPDFLAHADAFLVTADSVNMTGEAAATGRPVLVFYPSGGSAKFRRFHAALEAYGATRPLPERVAEIPDWTYEPLHSADIIAREIERRWLACKRVHP